MNTKEVQGFDSSEEEDDDDNNDEEEEDDSEGGEKGERGERGEIGLRKERKNNLDDNSWSRVNGMIDTSQRRDIAQLRKIEEARIAKFSEKRRKHWEMIRDREPRELEQKEKCKESQFNDWQDYPELVALSVKTSINGFGQNNKLNLKKIALKLQNTIYNPSKVDACEVELLNPNCKVSVYATGSMNISGAKSFISCIFGARKVAKMIRDYCGYDIKSLGKADTYGGIGVARLGFHVDLDRFGTEFDERASFDREIENRFLRYRDPRKFGDKGVCQVFPNGQLRIMGFEKIDLFMDWMDDMHIHCSKFKLKSNNNNNDSNNINYLDDANELANEMMNDDDYNDYMTSMRRNENVSMLDEISDSDINEDDNNNNTNNSRSKPQSNNSNNNSQNNNDNKRKNARNTRNTRNSGNGKNTKNTRKTRNVGGNNNSNNNNINNSNEGNRRHRTNYSNVQNPESMLNEQYDYEKYNKTNPNSDIYNHHKELIQSKYKSLYNDAPQRGTNFAFMAQHQAPAPYYQTHMMPPMYHHHHQQQQAAVPPPPAPPAPPAPQYTYQQNMYGAYNSNTNNSNPYSNHNRLGNPYASPNPYK